jgi:membrane-bound lytic murein transglycosylase D
MRVCSQSSVVAAVAMAAGSVLLSSVLLSSCAVSSSARAQPFRSFLLPPSLAASIPALQPVPDPPVLMAGAYANEAPDFGSSLPVIPRVTDTDFILRRAEDRFAAGKKAIQDGRTEEARSEFDKAIEILLSAPEETAERPRLEKRLQEMIDAIYQYDAGELGAGQPAVEASSDGRPLDELLEMTFPVDPSLRNKVREQIQATVSQLPLEENDAVVSYINYFSSPRGKSTLEAGLRQSGRYKPMIQRILAEEGLPQELIFLAQAESGFKPQAVSNKACVGLWQFLKSRGEEYGLHVTPGVDERMDPEKATRAAARHLHDLYEHLGDWYLAMAAYDCGPGCIDHAVARTGYADFWTLRRMNVLPKETNNYVPVILAMIIVSKNAKDYGLEEIDPDPPMGYDTVELESPTSLALAAAAVDRPIAELKDLNPALLKSTAPGGYQLRVPSGTRDQLEQAFAAIPAAQRDSWRLHRVETGDTAAALAKRYGTTAEMIASVNRGELPEPGTFAAIPVAYAGDRPPVVKRAAKNGPAASVAAVVKGGKPGVASAVASSAKAPAKPSAPSVVAVKAPVKKPDVAQTPRKTPARKPATAPHTPGA